MNRIKTYEELTLAVDFIFCKVMVTNPDLCKELVELIIGKKVRKINIFNEQDTIRV